MLQCCQCQCQCRCRCWVCVHVGSKAKLCEGIKKIKKEIKKEAKATQDEEMKSNRGDNEMYFSQSISIIMCA